MARLENMDISATWRIVIEMHVGEGGTQVQRGRVFIRAFTDKPLVINVPARVIDAGGWEERGIAEVLRDAAKLIDVLPIDDMLTAQRERESERKNGAIE